MRVLSVIAAAVIVASSQSKTDGNARDGLLEWPGFLRVAHSHNDYERERPLRDAVASRVTSIEVDLFFENGGLMVGHDRPKWVGEFETMYLRPLDQLWHLDALPVARDGTFLLWLDLKEDNAGLLRELHRLLEKYPVTSRRSPDRGHVQVILTGNGAAKETHVEQYPSESVSRDSNIFAADDPPASAGWSWYALDWKRIGVWNGEGAMPAAEREQLAELARKIHANGRKLRLWNHPATRAFWEEASAAGVDRLGTNALPGAPAEPSQRLKE